VDLWGLPERPSFGQHFSFSHAPVLGNVHGLGGGCFKEPKIEEPVGKVSEDSELVETPEASEPCGKVYGIVKEGIETAHEDAGRGKLREVLVLC
jgi:hypothetical protein